MRPLLQLDQKRETKRLRLFATELLVVAAVAVVHVDPRDGGVIIQALVISEGLDTNPLADKVPPLITCS